MKKDYKSENKNLKMQLEDAYKKVELQNLMINELEKRIRKNAVNNILLDFHQQSFTSAAASLIINPDPIYTYDINTNLSNIIIIKSGKKYKEIYYKKTSINKLNSDKIYRKVVTNNFTKLLFDLQKQSTHLLRVHKSFAINIYHYSLNAAKKFDLIIEPPKGFDKELINIPTDIFFKPEFYHTRLMEIDFLNKTHKDVSINLKKIKEIEEWTRSQNSPVVPL